MQFTDEPLDLASMKIAELEKNVCYLQDNITILSEQLRETQRYLIKLAHNQQEITKRISMWPFIAVNTKGE